MSLRSMLTQTCTIQRAANTRNTTYGGLSAGFVNVASGVSCAIQIASLTGSSDSEKVEFNRRNGRVVYRAYFEPGTSLQIKDRFVTLGGTNIEPTAREYDVISPPNDQAGRGCYLTCLCEFVTREGQT